MVLLAAPPVITRNDVVYEKCRRSLGEFHRRSWAECFEKGRPLIESWHDDCICEHLQAVTDGEIQNLIIGVPPRTGKSSRVAVSWQPWCWIHDPTSRWIFGSHSDDYATRDNVRARDLIKSDWYRRGWGHLFQLTKELETRFWNDQAGQRFAVGVRGGATGEGGDYIVIDDPHNVQQADSEAHRASVIRWYRETMSTRLNDRSTSRRVIIMQRVHEGDLVGWLEKQNGDGPAYTKLVLPMESEKRTVIRMPKSGREVLREEGDLLCPKRFDEEAVRQMRVEMGPRAYAAQCQQRPSPEGGGLIHVGKFRFYKELPNFDRVVQCWDTAAKKKETNDWSVGMCWGVCDQGYFAIDRVRKRMHFPELRQRAQTFYAAHCIQREEEDEDGKPRVVIVRDVQSVLVEDKSSGEALAQTLDEETLLPVTAIQVNTDKVARTNIWTPLLEAGKVFLPEGADWIEEYLREMEVFPDGAHDDQVDCTSLGLTYLKTQQSAGLRLR